MSITTSNISTLKKHLQHLPKEIIIDYCIRMAKYKKDNKELLHYLAFEAGEEDNYIKAINQEVTTAFENINRSNLYYAKKNIRTILKTVNKHCKYTEKRTSKIELLIHFCLQMKNCGIPFKKHKALFNLYSQQVLNIRKNINMLHEDHHLDYEDDLIKLKI
jgi:hypothetical protein